MTKRLDWDKDRRMRAAHKAQAPKYTRWAAGSRIDLEFRVKQIVETYEAAKPPKKKRFNYDYLERTYTSLLEVHPDFAKCSLASRAMKILADRKMR
jgi:hypothetical protein